MQPKQKRIIRQRTWICPQCFSDETGPLEFDTEKEFKEHIKKVHTVSVNKPQQINKPESVVEKPKEPVPLKLTYKYIGQCSKCGGEIDTIKLDIKSDHFCICWCNNCKLELAQRKVVKL